MGREDGKWEEHQRVAGGPQEKSGGKGREGGKGTKSLLTIVVITSIIGTLTTGGGP
jgi:hypothetical protein